MMDKNTALSVLRLEETVDRTQIVSAYNRLARRYPMQQFPQRHNQLLQAKEVLLNPQVVFQDIFHNDVLNLKWLNQFTTNNNKNSDNNPRYNSKECLEALLRPHFARGFELFYHESTLENMLSDLDPAEIEEMMKQMEGFR
ncbi:hypothetical protein JYU12_00775 [bacterium AH-315-K03]|nr:hypothetical protein [bacterium AH-315-K03]